MTKQNPPSSVDDIVIDISKAIKTAKEQATAKVIEDIKSFINKDIYKNRERILKFLDEYGKEQT